MAARRSVCEARGERMRVGPIDPRCVSSTNAPPALTAEQAAARTWRPDAETWRVIRQRSASAPATLRITGYLEGSPRQAVSRGQVTIRTVHATRWAHRSSIATCP